MNRSRNSTNESSEMYKRHNSSSALCNGDGCTNNQPAPASGGLVHDDIEEAVIPDKTGLAKTVASNSDKKAIWIGRMLLLCVSLLHGTLTVGLRLVYAQENPPSPSVLSTIRGWLSVLCFGPFLVSKLKSQRPRSSSKESELDEPLLSHKHAKDREDDETERTNNEKEDRQNPPTTAKHEQRGLRWVALELAFLNLGAMGLVTISLLWISSVRASFLTQTSVIITPIISALSGQTLKWNVWVGCMIAMIGLVMLSNTDGTGFGNFSAGDLLTMAGALCWSLYLFRLSSCSKYDEVFMQAWKTFFLACLYSLWLFGAWVHTTAPLWMGASNIVVWLVLFFSALGPGTVADVIQQKGQAAVSASEANLIISMEPVFSSLLGFMFLGELMTVQEYMGGGILILAATLATL